MLQSFKKFLQVMTVCQKVPKSYFQSQFWMSKINRFFSKKKLSKNINLGDHYLLKTSLTERTKIYFFIKSAVSLKKSLYVHNLQYNVSAKNFSIDEIINYENEIPEKYIKIRQSSYVPFIYTIVVIHSSYQSTIFHASVSIIGEIPRYTAKKPQGETFL